jgi:hypothetical protein
MIFVLRGTIEGFARNDGNATYTLTSGNYLMMAFLKGKLFSGMLRLLNRTPKRKSLTVANLNRLRINVSFDVYIEATDEEFQEMSGQMISDCIEGFIYRQDLVIGDKRCLTIYRGWR